MAIISDDDIDNMDFPLEEAPARVPPTASTSGLPFNPSGGPAASTSSHFNNAQVQYISDPSAFKHYQVIYPIYIDANRPHKNGERRVNKKRAIKYPQAQEMGEACGRFLGLKVCYEPEKTHPRDWQNPGRIRVLIKEQDGSLVNTSIKDSTSWHCPMQVKGNSSLMQSRCPEYVLLNTICNIIRTIRQTNKRKLTGITVQLPMHSPAISFGTLEESLKGGGKMQEMMQGMLGGAGGAGGPTPEQEEETTRQKTERELAEKQKMAKMKALQKQGRRMQGRR